MVSGSKESYVLYRTSRNAATVDWFKSNSTEIVALGLTQLKPYRSAIPELTSSRDLEIGLPRQTSRKLN